MIKLQTNISKKIILAFVVVSSIIPDVGFSISIAGFHLTLYRFVILITIVFLVVMYGGKIVLSEKSFLPKFELFFAAWILYGMFLLFISNHSDYHAGLVEMISLTCGLLTVLILGIIITETELLKDIGLIVTVTINALLILALLEIVTGHHLPMSAFNDVESSLHQYANSHLATGFSYNVNDFSALLTCMVPVVFILSKSSLKWLTLLGVVFVNVINDATICNLAIIVCIVVYYIFFSNSINVERRFVRIALIVFAVIVAVLLLLFFRSFLATQKGILKTLAIQMSNAQSGSGSLFSRVVIYRDTIAAWLNGYILGCGPSSFSNYFVQHPSLSGLINPHSLFLEILFEYGIVIFMMFIGCLLLLLKRASWFYKRSSSSEMEKYNVLVILSLITYVIASFAPSAFLGCSYQWLIVAICSIIIDFDKCFIKEEIHA